MKIDVCMDVETGRMVAVNDETREIIPGLLTVEQKEPHLQVLTLRWERYTTKKTVTAES